MDGVIANFNRQLLKYHHRPDLLEKEAKGEYPTDWYYDGELGETEDTLWWPVILAGASFWSDIEDYKWATALLEILDNTGIDWYLCTQPYTSPDSYSGKYEWIHNYFGSTFDRVIMTKHKYLLAHANALLIDDKESNCDKFVEAGGKAYLFPQPWNRNSGLNKFVWLRTALELTFGKEIHNVAV
jgi:5'(3')-deoxyribonucleotidase